MKKETKNILLFIIYWINVLFWFGVAFITTISKANIHIVALILLYLESILLTIFYFGIRKECFLCYIFAILQSIGNIILSITDDIGILDIISLIFSVQLLIILLVNKPKENIKRKNEYL